MQNNGYITLPIDTYEAWKAAVNGNGYNADGFYGDQCWDLVAEFWYNVGFPQGYPSTGGTGSAYGIWDARTLNAGAAFDLIYDKTQILKGDIIVYNYYTGNPDGHVGFADQDYQGNDSLQILSQNNGGTPYAQGGTYTNVRNYNLAHFRGAFRYKVWQETPPVLTGNNKFPWVLYSRKLRRKQ